MRISSAIDRLRNARCAWIWPVLVLVVATAAVDFGHRPQPIGIDVHTYLAAARVVVDQGWAHVYDQALVAAQQANLVPNERTQPFLSPPPAAWLAVGLVPPSYAWAHSIWAGARRRRLVGHRQLDRACCRGGFHGRSRLGSASRLPGPGSAPGCGCAGNRVASGSRPPRHCGGSRTGGDSVETEHGLRCALGDCSVRALPDVCDVFDRRRCRDGCCGDDCE